MNQSVVVEETDDGRSTLVDNPLTHVVDDEIFVFPLPLMLREPGEKSNDYVMVFSIWNTMIGTIVVCLPWAFQQAGIALSVSICFSSFLVSFYTCKLIVDVTKNDADFCITLKRYFGSCGYYAGIIFPLITLLGAAVVLFILLSQLLYPICMALYSWIFVSGSDPPKPQLKPVFYAFSPAYTSLFLYVVLVLVSSKKNLGVFIRLGSLGSIFVSMFIIGIVCLAIYSFKSTEYRIGTT